MALLVPTNVARVGGVPSYVAANVAGDNFPNNGQTFLIVKNAGASPCIVTVNSIAACNMGFDHDITITVPITSGERWIGPFGPDRFNNQADGTVGITYSQVASVTVAVAQMTSG